MIDQSDQVPKWTPGNLQRKGKKRMKKKKKTRDPAFCQGVQGFLQGTFQGWWAAVQNALVAFDLYY